VRSQVVTDGVEDAAGWWFLVATRSGNLARLQSGGAVGDGGRGCVGPVVNKPGRLGGANGEV
jgi:hypothetical protein